MSSFITFNDDVPDRRWEHVSLVRNVDTGELAVVVSSTLAEADGREVLASTMLPQPPASRPDAPRRGRPPGPRR